MSEPLSGEELGVLLKALTIGRISWDGDGWFAADAGYDYDEAEAVLDAASVLVSAKAREYNALVSQSEDSPPNEVRNDPT